MEDNQHGFRVLAALVVWLTGDSGLLFKEMNS